MAAGLLDTSTLLLLPRISDPASLPDEPLISAITLAELSVGPLVTEDLAERGARQAQVHQAEADFDPLPFDAPAARALAGWQHRYVNLVERPPPGLTTP